ncbi:MAG: DJ-1/PfpI family protein [Bacilli bacterium]|nr:DJ-1/PfpI family protein [Bacilli bacterium]
MKCCILLADGFETTEALTTYDVLVRSHKIEPELVSISASFGVTSSHGVTIRAARLIKGVDVEDYDFIILPGGKKGVDNLKSSGDVHAFLLKAIEKGKDVHAICAAPSILGELGYLDGKRFTCFPGFQVGKGTYTGEGVTVEGNLITGKSMGYSIPFAEAIVAKYCGQETVEMLRKGTLGLDS